jgi:hypothetical protein
MAKIKREMLDARGQTAKDAGRAYELDHIIPVELGGALTDQSNLRLEPREEAYRKDRIEHKLNCLVCTGQVDLITARTASAADWERASDKYSLVKCRRHNKPSIPVGG